VSRLIFKIVVKPLLYFISVWPFFLLYRLSDFLFFLVYYVIGYRRKVVIVNLRNSFAEKSDEEIRKIERQFYRHFCDVIVEIVKLLTISDASFKKHFRLTINGVNTFKYFEEKKLSIVGIMGHCGNWEWGAIAHQFYFKQLITGVYHPLSNKNFDAFMLKLRSRKGGNIVAMKNLYRELLRLKSEKIPTTIGLIGDQTPPPESAYWTNFLNQDTPVFNGAEKLSKKFNYPVLYVSVKKLRRGYYEMDTQIITEDPHSLPEGKITELHTHALEENIRSQPFIWLWTHKRWKHKRPK
jgi:Kdo2-lipid IVA lauroyltransferase/acyltransferase